MGNTSSSSPLDALPSSSKSTVTAVADTETGFHVLTVNGFSKIRLGVGKSINSGTFIAGGHSWYIALFPEGESTSAFVQEYHRSGWRQMTCVSVFVYLEHPRTDADVKARFELSLLRHDGKRISGHRRRSDADVLLDFRTPRWGKNKYITRSHLFSHLRGHDSFHVRCDVTVVRDVRLDTITPRHVAVPPPDLHRHLSALLESGAGADVTFHVRGEAFAAHRAVLAARSPVFMSELFGHMKEEATSSVRIDDVEPGVFGAVLHFVYTDSLPETVTAQAEADMAAIAQHLLVAADKYGLERLRLMCEDKLCGCIDLKTVAMTLSLAELHGCRSLKDACVKFIMCHGNFKSLMANDEFEHLRRSCPSLVNELLARVIT